MKFLYPEFLWALSLIAIPIIIHLFNFRKFKKVYFSDISLLKEVKEETKSRSQLKHILILISRILAISALVLAFCYPFIPSDNQKGDNLDKTVSIYIDNSLSMDIKGPNGYFLDLAKNQAMHIVNQYNNDVKFHLISNNFEAKHQRALSKNEIIELIAEISPTSIQKELKSIYTRQSEILKSFDTQKDVYWLTDLQKSNREMDLFQKDSTMSIFLIPYQNNEQENLYIDSVWFNTPSRKLNQQEDLFVRVINTSKDNIQFKLDLSINRNETKGLTNCKIEAKSQLIAKVTFKVKAPGIKHGTLKISDYPNPNLTFDDTYYFSYFIKEKIKVLHLFNNISQNTTSYFQSLYNTTPLVDFESQSINQADYSSIHSNDLIILDGLTNITSGLKSIIYECLENGKTIVVYPGSDIDQESYNDLYNPTSIQFNGKDTTNSIITELNLEHAVFKNVFEKVNKNMNLPKVRKKYNLSIASNSVSNTIISLNDLSPFLVYSEFKNGVIYSFSSPADENATNFVNHALFVPVMLRITELCGTKQKLDYVIGLDLMVKTNAQINSSEGLSVTHLNKENINFIPGFTKQGVTNSLIVQEQIQNDGNFNLLKSGLLIDGFSFNYNRDESNMSFYNKNEFNNQLTRAGIKDQVKIYDLPPDGDYINFKNEALGILYWKYFIVLTLVFLGIEILLIRIL